MALEHNAYLGRDDLGKLLRSFSLPCILSLLVSALYNIVDQIFIGNSELGYLGNAATWRSAGAWGTAARPTSASARARVTPRAPTGAWAAGSP